MFSKYFKKKQRIREHLQKKVQIIFWFPVKDNKISDNFCKIQNFIATSWLSMITTCLIKLLSTWCFYKFTLEILYFCCIDIKSSNVKHLSFPIFFLNSKPFPLTMWITIAKKSESLKSSFEEKKLFIWVHLPPTYRGGLY